MKFGKIDRIILMGGGRLLVDFAIYLSSIEVDVHCFTSHRQHTYLAGIYVVDDICSDGVFQSLITDTTLVIGIGEAWKMDERTIDLLKGRLVDVMGIPLPQYRGGAHHSWQIMRRSKLGGCCIQLINKDTEQGVFDSGEILKSCEYIFPPDARIPQDYFNDALIHDLAFLKEFIKEVQAEHDFTLTKVQETFSMYFPRLYTKEHGYINWAWKTRDIESFICAFDNPYEGAATFLNGTKVLLKDCYAEYNDGAFHPFQAGLIYRKSADAVFVATIDGTIVIKNTTGLTVGDRFFTPIKHLEESMMYRADYDSKGVII